MSCRAGFVWESPQYFNRYIEECGIACDLVTPHMLAAPFYRGNFSCLIIPTGFANPQFSRILPAVRASSERIESFVERGGNLLVFGAAADKPDAYDWLPEPVTYHHDVRPRRITCAPGFVSRTLVEDYDPDRIECDGTFTSPGWESSCNSDGEPVVVERQVGKGRIVVTSVHEYPSRGFLRSFCRLEGEVQF
ncbi:MAG TPA: hypothetical protein VLY83_03160 [Methanoregula sp.]|nr:hypothetical protein [Methanoregula sp.]